MSPHSGARAVPKYKIETFHTKHDTSPVTQYYRPLTQTNSTNTATIHVNGPIKHQNPFGFRVRPLLRDWFLAIFR